MKITVIGTSEVALLKGAIFSVAGHSVCCIVPELETYEKLKRGQFSVEDPGMANSLQNAALAGRLRFEHDVNLVACDSDAVMITADNRFAGKRVREDVLQNLKRIYSTIPTAATVLIMANVPNGTAEELQKLLFHLTGTRHSVATIAQPTLNTQNISEALCPTRIVAGLENKNMPQLIDDLYQPFADKKPKRVLPINRISSEFESNLASLRANKYARKIPAMDIDQVLSRILKHFDGNLDGKRIAIWGSAEDETVAASEAQSLRLAKRLVQLGAICICHCNLQYNNELNSKVITVANKHEALRNASALIVASPSSQYVGISSDPGMLTWKMDKVVVFDVWGCLDRKNLTYGSAVYYSITEGRPFQDMRQGYGTGIFTLARSA